MREEQARVVAVEGGKATVELDRNERCDGCGLCAATGGGQMRLVLDATALLDKGLRPGRTVIVAIDRSVSLRSVFLLFGLPLVGLVAGAAIGHVCPLPGMKPDASSALLAVVLLVAAFVVALLYERKFAAKTLPQPTILRIESE